MSGRLRQILVVASVVGVLIVNFLSQAIPFNNQTSAQIVNRFQDNNFFLPQNYVFSIWGVIYIGLIAFAVFQALPSQRDNPRMNAVALPFILSSIANATWLFLFHYNQFWLSTVAMIVLFVSLLYIYLRLRAGRPQISLAERLMVRLPFSIYFGWITVATVANFTYALLNDSWDGFGISYQTWGVIMLVVATVIGGLFAFRNRDIAYALVLTWSFVGILARHPSVAEVALTAGVAAGLVAVAGLIGFMLGRARGDRGTLTPQRA